MIEETMKIVNLIRKWLNIIGNPMKTYKEDNYTLR